MRYLICAVALLLAACTVMLAEATRLGACTCPPTPTVEESLEGAQIVFSGTVIGTEWRPDDGEVKTSRVYQTFMVDRLWKGMDKVDENAQVTLATDYGDTCGEMHHLGEETLLYAFCGSDGDCRTNICLRGGLGDAEELGAPVAEYGPHPLPEALQILDLWVIEDREVAEPMRSIFFSEWGDYQSWNDGVDGLELWEEGDFTLSGNTLTVHVRDSFDPDREGTIFTSEVSFPKPGWATFTNAARLTAGLTDEETITVGSRSTGVDVDTWGCIKALFR